MMYLLCYSSLILNFFTLTPMKIMIMPSKISVSFQTYMNPVPLSMMFLMMMMKYLGGIILHKYCKMMGMFSMGIIKPESNMVGNINAINDINMATCWVFTRVEIKIPSERASVINKSDSAKSSARLP